MQNTVVKTPNMAAPDAWTRFGDSCFTRCFDSFGRRTREGHKSMNPADTTKHWEYWRLSSMANNTVARIREPWMSHRCIVKSTFIPASSPWSGVVQRPIQRDLIDTKDINAYWCLILAAGSLRSIDNIANDYDQWGTPVNVAYQARFLHLLATRPV